MIGDVFLRLAGITKHFGDRLVLHEVNLEVMEGEILAVLGASGCGKTTMLRVIAGLEHPDAGEVWIAGKLVGAGGKNLVPPSGRGIGFVFQDLALWPHLTVGQSLDFVLASAGVPKRERLKRISEVLELVRIQPYTDKYPSQLSGGEQQRAAIARALIARPRLLLLDEPMSNLDADLKRELSVEFVNLQQLLNVTTIYITHDSNEAQEIASRVAIMKNGRIADIMPARFT